MCGLLVLCMILYYNNIFRVQLIKKQGKAYCYLWFEKNRGLFCVFSLNIGYPLEKLQGIILLDKALFVRVPFIHKVGYILA